MHKLEPREDVLSPIISKAISPKRALGDMGVVWGCCDLLQHEELSKYTTISSVRSQTLPMPISTNLHTANTQIPANAHNFFFFFFGVNFDLECIWRHLNELQLVFHSNVPILKTITIRNACSNANYSFEVPLYSLL